MSAKDTRRESEAKDEDVILMMGCKAMEKVRKNGGDELMEEFINTALVGTQRGF